MSFGTNIQTDRHAFTTNKIGQHFKDNFTDDISHVLRIKLSNNWPALPIKELTRVSELLKTREGGDIGLFITLHCSQSFIITFSYLLA